jgi:hypothetical protein
MKKLSRQNFSKRASQHDLRSIANVKKKPRGKPFEPGNKIGNRFKQGEPSANPSGRPKSREINKAYRDWISANVTLEELQRHKLPCELLGHSRAEVIAWVRGEATLRGSLSDGIELADRAEGKPAVTLTGVGGEDPLRELIGAVDAVRLQIYGPPEGMRQRKEITDGNSSTDGTEESGSS